MPENEDKLLATLLADESFRKWAASGSFRKTGNYWSDWLAGHPGHAPTVRRAIDVVLASYWEETVAREEIEKVLKGTDEKIRSSNRRRETRRTRWRALAASVLLAGVLAWVNDALRKGDPPAGEAQLSPSAGGDWSEFRNAGSVNRSRVLPDGSSVVLLPGSRVLYPGSFGDSARTIKLSGTAYFEVAQKSGIPFFVQAPGVTVKVTGTSFGLRAPGAPEAVELSVHSGSVAVYPEKASPLTLVAGRQIRYSPGSGELKLADQFGWMSRILNDFQTEFEEERVSDILDKLGKAYGMRVQYNKSRFSACRLTTSLYDLPLPNKLALIAASLGNGSHYKITAGDEIIFDGRGCSSTDP